MTVRFAGAPARLLRFGLALVLLACQDVERIAAPGPRSDRASDARAAGDGGVIVLRGTVVTPDSVMKHGYVAIADGRIIAVSEKRPDIPDAVVVNTEGIILPGFVDVHDHVYWNVLPRWTPSHVFTDQPDWADDPEFLTLRRPADRLLPSRFCDMNAWGELRALVGGTTSIMATQAVPCIHGLVRNLDYNSGFYGTTELDRERIYNADGFRFPPPSDLTGRATLVAAARFLLADPRYEALALHVAEGKDDYAREQFSFLEAQRLLNSKGVLIHGVALTPGDFQAMAAAGTALVWSPRSNLELYGATANVAAALDAGVEIALAPDWALTGSSNMLDELKVAARWNRERLGGRLTDRQLVDMATSVAAHVVAIDDEVGAIRVGLRADLLVLGGDHDDALRAVVEADVRDVRLVLIGGVPLYGERRFMERFQARSDLEAVVLPGATKALAKAGGIVVSEIAARLQTALASEGASLAPLAEPAPR